MSQSVSLQCAAKILKLSASTLRRKKTQQKLGLRCGDRPRLCTDDRLIFFAIDSVEEARVALVATRKMRGTGEDSSLASV
jgi:hypothetical protein